MVRNDVYEHLGDRLLKMYSNWIVLENVIFMAALFTSLLGITLESFIIFMAGAIMCVGYVVYYFDYRVTGYIMEILNRKFE